MVDSYLQSTAAQKVTWKKGRFPFVVYFIRIAGYRFEMSWRVRESWRKTKTCGSYFAPRWHSRNADYSITRYVNRQRRAAGSGGRSFCVSPCTPTNVVWSENTLLFHRDKKFSVRIITSELIGPSQPPTVDFHWLWVADLLPPTSPLSYRLYRCLRGERNNVCCSKELTELCANRGRSCGSSWLCHFIKIWKNRFEMKQERTLRLSKCFAKRSVEIVG